MKWVGEVVQVLFMEWLDFQWQYDEDFDLDTTLKPKNYLWEHNDENLPEWDGQLDEDFDEDTKWMEVFMVLVMMSVYVQNGDGGKGIK